MKGSSVPKVRSRIYLLQPFSMLACVGLLWLLLACAQTPTPTIEDIEFSISADPTTAPLLERLISAYQDERPNVTAKLEQMVNTERALEAMQTGRVGLAAVSWLPDSIKTDEAIWNRPFARDSLVIITHSSNPVGDLTLSQLRAIFQGQVLTWSDLGGLSVDVVPVSREDGSGTRLGFETLVMGRRDVSPTAVVMPSQESVVEFVSMSPGAIGYVSPAWLKPSVNLVAVEGSTPSPSALEQGRYLLARPFFLVAHTGPNGGLVDFVDWVTKGNGLQIITRDYALIP